MSRLELLASEEIELENRLRSEATAAKVDVSQILKLERARDEIQSRMWAESINSMRERIAAIENERALTVETRTELEAKLTPIGEAWARAKSEEFDRRIEHQEIEVKLFALDSRLETSREELNDLQSQLKRLIESRLTRRAETGNEFTFDLMEDNSQCN